MALTVDNFNLRDADDDYRHNPYPMLKELRDKRPLFQNPDGSYVVTRYADVDKILTSSDVSVEKSEEYRAIMGDGPILEFQLSAMTCWDPPAHGKLRGTLAHAFTPRAMRAWESMIVETVDDLLEEPRKTGKMDLIADFSAALPLTVICKMLGVPTDNWTKFRAWAGSITTSLDPAATPEIITLADKHTLEWKEYIGGLLNERRKNPGDDLISVLLANQPEDEPFSEETLIHNIALLLSAGHETTTALISNGIDNLLDHPDQAEILRNDPSLFANAVEEFLRYDAPVQMGNRKTLKPIEVSGGTIPAGALVWTVQGAANRDERMFPDPDTLDVQRKNAGKHIAFATGIHVCLGAPLARMEARIAIERLVMDFPDMVRDGDPERYLRTRFRCFGRYPVLLYGKNGKA